ncbi:MAG TPA: hypothetical protein VNH18_34670 [Bryobacteraceae bacterium]|nr:hypothetical protein [Bryobacteraceae bacterium]
MARAAGRLVGRLMPKAKRAAKDWSPAAEHSRQFVKHVVPAAIKPVHALWHEILGFVFLAFAGLGAYRIWRRQDQMPPMQMAIVLVFVIVMAGYGIASVMKARKISRS